MRAIFLLPALLALGACTTTTAATDAATDRDALRFSGQVQAIDNGCFADAVCSVTVDGVQVVTMVGWSRETWGQRTPDLAVGTPVDVYCRKTAEGCTLSGSADYYVRRKG